MKNEKIKIEIDLIRDSLRNIFIVMFAIMSGEVSLFYKLVKKFNYLDFAVFILGFVFVLFLLKVKAIKREKINNLLNKMEE
jgi:hypothetical protein